MMLALPGSGFARSVEKHNVRLDVLCDWLEGSVLFAQAQLAAAEVVDILVENSIYKTQEFAWKLLSDAWTELRRRAYLLKDGYPLEIKGWRLTPRYSWDTNPGHSFCLALSLAEWLPDWARSFDNNYSEQGELFEEFVAEAIERSLPDWSVHRTGWRKTKAVKLPGVVAELCQWLGESETGNRDRWTSERANDAELDLVCVRRMPDGRPGIPLYLVQCASGVTGSSEWKYKRRTPDLDVWEKIVDFAVRPKRGFATPFTFTEADFRHHCHAVGGLFLDRYRLLAPSATQTSWLSTGTAHSIRRWLRPRLKKLPNASAKIIG
jgi:hypothetical protein